MRYAAFAFAVGIGLSIGASQALAGDPPAPAEDDAATAKVKELEKQVAEHVTAKATDALTRDIAEVTKAYGEVADEKLKSRVAILAGQILQAADDETLKRTAIRAIGQIGDMSAYKFMDGYVKQPDPKTVPPLLLDAIDAAGKMKAENAVDSLLQIVTKTKTYNAAVAAMKALANYGGSKRVRAKILTDLVGTVRKDKPGRAPKKMTNGGVGDDGGIAGGRTGEQGQSRWSALSGQLVETLNKLTGQNYATPEDWFGVFDKYKKSLEADVFGSR